MGVSTDAILIYGYAWAEEKDLFQAHRFGDGDDDDAEWPELLLRKRGVKNPWDDYPITAEMQRQLSYETRDSLSRCWMAENEERLDAWRQRQEAVEREFGVIVGRHCSGECPMPYVAAWKLVAHRGSPVAVAVPVGCYDAWDARLATFLAEFGIVPPQEHPGQWLVSYWS